MTDRRTSGRAWYEGYRVSARSLAIFRLLFGTMLLVLLLPRFQWIARFPDAFFHPPPGLTSLFSGFPSRAYFMGVDALLITATIFLIAGRSVGLASCLISAGMLAGNVWAYSFGKIDHDILLVILPLFMAAAGWHGHARSRAWPMALFALVISLAMATAAWQKIASGWLDLSASAVLGHSVAFAVAGGEPPAWQLALRHLPSAAWELMDYATVGLESAFIIFVGRAALFRTLCGAACVFHLVVAQLMPITFLSNIPAYAAFVDWEDVTARAGVGQRPDRVQRWLSRRPTWQLLAASGAVSFVYLRWGNAVRLAAAMLGPEHASLPRMVALWITAGVVVILIVFWLTDRTSVYPSVRFRTATPEDAPAVARLINQAFRVEDFFKTCDRTSAAGIVEMMADGEFLLLDNEDGAPMVAVFVSHTDGRGYFGMLSVDPRMQGRGLAHRVIDAVEDRFRRAGCHSIDIHMVSLRTELPGFYHNLGYVESGTKPFPRPEELTRPCHLIVMTKALGSGDGAR